MFHVKHWPGHTTWPGNRREDNAMPRPTGITQRSAENGFATPMPCDADHMSAFSCLGWRSAFHHRGFDTPSGQWLEVFWTTDTRTGHVTDIFEDTRGLNLK